MSPRTASLALLGTMVLGACSGDAVPMPDASVVDSGMVLAVTPPAISWLDDGAPPVAPPTLTPCPAGWREISGEEPGEVVECRPYPDADPAPCGEGEAHFPGEMGCAPVGAPCPPGPFAADLPSDGSVTYVDAGASVGGSGTLASPYGSLAEVPWGSLTAGTTVTLAKGTYPGMVNLRPGVRLLGACAAETILVGGGSDPLDPVALAESPGDEASIENLSIIDPPQRGVIARNGATLVVRGTVIRGALLEGIDAFGGTVRAERVVVDGTRTPDAFASINVRADIAGLVDADHVLISGAATIGAYASAAGSRLRFSDTVFTGAQQDAIEVEDGGSVEATGIVISRSGSGINAHGPASAATVTHAVLEDLTELNLAAFRAIDGAELTAEKVVVVGSPASAFGAAGVGTSVTANDLVLRDGPATGVLPYALGVLQGAALTGARIQITGRRGTAIALDGAGSRAQIMDLAIEEFESADYATGLVAVQAGAELLVERGQISRSAGNAMSIISGGFARITDFLVETPRPGDDGSPGRGIQLREGGVLEANSLLITGAYELGLLVTTPDTRATLMDAIIRDGVPNPVTGEAGRGMQAQDGAVLEGDRVAIEGGYEIGVASLTGASVVLRNLRVTKVAASSCLATTCPQGLGGYGVVAVDGAARVNRFAIEESGTCGVFLAPLSAPPDHTTIDLEAGSVSACPIGACVQIEGYDLNRLSLDVSYGDNDTNLDATSLPIPSADPS